MDSFLGILVILGAISIKVLFLIGVGLLLNYNKQLKLKKRQENLRLKI